MQILAHDEKEFTELIRTFRYLHDITHWKRMGINWKFWQWFSYRSIFIIEGHCLNLWAYPLLNSIAHLYRIEYAHLEGELGIEESEYYKKIFRIDNKVENTLKLYEEHDDKTNGVCIQ